MFKLLSNDNLTSKDTKYCLLYRTFQKVFIFFFIDHNNEKTK